MPRKPTKKAEKPAAPKCCYPVLGTPYDRERCGKPAKFKVRGDWYCEGHFNPFPGTHSGSIITGAKITTTTPLRSTGDEGRKLEEIRKMAERWKRRFWEANRGKDEAVCGMAAAGMMVLRILESTPTAKGRRGK